MSFGLSANPYTWASSYRVLVVDDDAAHQSMIERILSKGKFLVTSVSNGEDAISLLSVGNTFDVVLLDKNLPYMSGYEVCRYVRETLKQHFLQIIIVTGSLEAGEVARSLEVGANDFIRKPYQSGELLARVQAAANHKRMTDQLDSAEAMLFALARMVEAKDEHTGDHCTRLSHIAVVFGRELGLTEEELLALHRGGVLHDVGKLGIPDSILLKGAALTPDEWQIMRQHTVIGARLCAGLKSMALTVPIIEHHHERWDGTGYPYGLKGLEIPLLARIFHIVDVYDALVSERPYKKAFSMDEAIRIMEEETAKGWHDPELTPMFIRMLRERQELLTVPDGYSQQLGGDIYKDIVATGVLHWDQRKREDSKLVG